MGTHFDQYGRKPEKEHPRTKVIAIRLSVEDKRILHVRAEAQGLPISTYCYNELFKEKP